MADLFYDVDYFQELAAREQAELDRAEAEADDFDDREPIIPLEAWDGFDDDDEDDEDDDDGPVCVFDDRNSRAFTDGADPYDLRRR